MLATLSRRPRLRRTLSLSALAVATLVGVALTPLLLPLALLRDVVGRRRFGLTRGLLVIALLLAMEVAGVARAGWAWLRHGGPLIGRLGRARAFEDANHALQRWWASTLWRVSQRILGVTVELSGADALAAAGPLLLMVRHASHADTLLPVMLLAPTRRRLRYVLKAELLLDPCLDIVGQRLNNAFVARGAGDTAAQVAQVARLAEGLDRDEAVVIFPEGTRVTPGKRSRVLARLEERGDRAGAALARQLERTLPPLRKGGLTLLERTEGADVVFLAHRGLEAATHLPNLLSGELVGATVKVHLWRVPASEVPRDKAGARAFLAAHWRAVDVLAGGVHRDPLTWSLPDPALAARLSRVLAEAGLPEGKRAEVI